MASGLPKRLLIVPLVAYFLSLTLFSSTIAASPQTPSSVQFGPPPGMDPTQLMALAALQYGSATIEIHLKEDGVPIEKEAIVTLTRPTGQFFNRANSKAGLVKFDRVPASEFNIQVIAAGYETAEKRIEVPSTTGGVTVEIELTRLSAEDAAASAGFYALPPKIQKDVGKALQALRANKPNDALHPLQSAQKNVPNNAEIEYLLGLYSSQVKDDAKARAYWMKALESNPKHLGSLLSISGDLVQQKKSAEAIPYARRAVEVEPASWRAHVLLAEALMMEKHNDDAIKESRRAIDLGHERAATAQLVLAHALAQRGDRDEAIQALEIYIKSHPTDANAAKDLETLKNPAVATTSVGANAGLDAAAEDAAALPIAANWRPTDVDDGVPRVEPGATCALDEVVRNAGGRINELMSDVDRFTATESLTHQSIDKWGAPSAAEKRKFEYVVSIQLLQGKYLNVEEYRSARGAPAEFPGGVVTNGLPSLVLIFHPVNVPNFDMTCEGLARTSSGLAWQVHFKQSPDKPNTVKRYRIGADGPSYPVALKGRAWISADTYQIVRLETDLVKPVPEIKLVADHSDIEYGPVKFKNGKVSMWLPQSADVYYDWRGRRTHRRHSFSQYLLFGVDERQKISAPKVDDPAAGTGSNNQPGKPQH